MFSSATFSGRTSFLGAKFSNLASSSATFSGETSFHLVTISNFADFSSATFSNYAIFGSTKFTGEDPTFSKSADFSSATFSKLADFGSANFSKSAEFISATFAGPTDLSSIKFCGDANFASARFSDVVNFLDTKFAAERRSPEQSLETRCPIFAGRQCTRPPNGMAQFGQSPRTTEMPRNRRSMPMNASSRRWSASRSTRMSSVFFRKGLRARRRLESPLSATRLLNFLYEALSDYGQSIGRPLLWIVVSFAIGYFVFAGTPVFNGTHLTRAGAVALSFANIFSFLPIRREIMTPEMIAGLSNLAQIVGVAQSLLGGILLFLLGLALRNRFRMR
jgi:hypothetical protein